MTEAAATLRAFVARTAAGHGLRPTRLMMMLAAIQAEYRHVPMAAIEQLAGLLAIPRTQIIAVVEFYHFFHLSPRGRYDILLSDSITDRMLGKDEVMARLSRRLGVEAGGVRADGLVSLDNTACTGLCDQGPAGLVNGRPLTRLDSARVDGICGLIEAGRPLAEWPAQWFAVADNLRQPGLLLAAPVRPGEAIRAAHRRGWQATLDEIDAAGLRGRGGAGFKTALKWRFCRDERDGPRFVVMNADEGEPGTFKDRVLLNSHAQQVFEGMTVAAAIVGARQGLVYLRAEYLFLYEPLLAVLAGRRRAGLLGDDVLGLGFGFDIEICLGAGAYVCGEESALIESLEGRMGIPRNRPPYPVTRGYLGKPTVVNNVETFFAAAAIAVRGGDWFAAHGSRQSKGTKLLSVSGDCARPGIYEFPFGTPVGSVLAACGAGDALGAQVGGPSGTFISDQEFGRALAFEDLATGGSLMVFNRSRDILRIVQNFSHFFANESCGFCTPCRVGTALLARQLDKIIDGHGSAGDVAALAEIARLVRAYSHCGLGQTAANPVLTTLQRYPELYQALLKKISYEPGFDLDGALATARRLANRDDAAAHLPQLAEE